MTIKPIISLSAFFVGYIVFLLIGRALSEYKIKKEGAREKWQYPASEEYKAHSSTKRALQGYYSKNYNVNKGA